ncbi:MAG TPA: LLM class flavin-dependent oxidoreductase [Chloroflexota bacterium]|jgi:alkanesulfonate monooxygenase SsuD/methylene tetrahydromethanopterin reductase-like flavin-dependent oxidoreductase (luciferase family)|nr:LLM class flavin-dependent oxidoreductase [Chloroflexota bacterium]
MASQQRKRLKFGIQVCDQHPAGDDMLTRFDELIEQVRLARELGFDTIVAAQHYLSHPHQMLQPLPLLGRLAAETGEMRLATCILLLPLLNPVDVAEQLATLNVIAHGRLAIGVGLGYRDEEFDAFGVPKGERVRRLEDNFQVLQRLLDGETVSFESSYCQLDNQKLAFIPERRPTFWLAANSDAAVRRAARMADTWVLNPHARLDTLTRQVQEVYRPALDDLGKPLPDELPMRREVYVGTDRNAALREAAPWLFPKYQTYAAWGQDSVLPEGDDFSGEFEELLKDRFILGSADECIDEIERYREALGITEIIVRIQWPGMPQLQAMKNIEMVGKTLVEHYSK